MPKLNPVFIHVVPTCCWRCMDECLLREYEKKIRPYLLNSIYIPRYKLLRPERAEMETEHQKEHWRKTVRSLKYAYAYAYAYAYTFGSLSTTGQE